MVLSRPRNHFWNILNKEITTLHLEEEYTHSLISILTRWSSCTVSKQKKMQLISNEITSYWISPFKNTPRGIIPLYIYKFTCNIHVLLVRNVIFCSGYIPYHLGGIFTNIYSLISYQYYTEPKLKKRWSKIPNSR